MAGRRALARLRRDRGERDALRLPLARHRPAITNVPVTESRHGIATA